SPFAPEMSTFTGMEHELAVALRATADEIARAECFDSEQRSEVYAILRALQADTTVHGELVEQLARRLRGGGADA
ncbi:unnamed protein product, partial [marine sediment metagenome]